MDTTFADANLAPGAAALFAPVLDWLDAGAPHNAGPGEDTGFNMGCFVEAYMPDYAGKNCNTVCCIAGALAEFNNIEHYQEIDSVGAHLGMDTDQMDALFYAIPPSGTEEGGLTSGHLRHVTPSMAAATIRRFLATGEIRWIWGE